MPKIDAMWAFISEDTGPDDEGLAAFLTGGFAMPMVAADPARVDSLRAIARTISRATGQKITLVKFSQREELETFSPGEGNGRG